MTTMNMTNGINSTQPTAATKSKNKSVTFASVSTLRLFNKREKPSQSWYSQADYESFRKDCRFTAKLAGKVGDITAESSNSYTCLGLEHLVDKELVALRAERRRRAWCAVFDVQQNQYSMGIESPELIAQSYKAVTKKSQADAQKRAKSFLDMQMFTLLREHFGDVVLCFDVSGNINIKTSCYGENDNERMTHLERIFEKTRKGHA